ncbi:hypothetical protein KNN17_21290 [Arthrobacter bambusae]|uniref:hypothetical protein n=1 Tax=Arthrobacter bambusae TaxID=1338426 RepID=UPI001F5124A8|nr:hypothetical protein [Arthrobacter bambusae]MCI0144093.1 hypothetical protein [Arthrobacter bambusae]
MDHRFEAPVTVVHESGPTGFVLVRYLQAAGINCVVARMRWAMQERHQGILVTQHDKNSFTVGLSDSAPFGLTHEHQDW